MGQKAENFGLFWVEKTPQNTKTGEGVSRSRKNSKAKLKPYKVVVRPQAGKDIKLYFKAENKARAKVYASNRWPNSEVVSVEESDPPSFTSK